VKRKGEKNPPLPFKHNAQTLWGKSRQRGFVLLVQLNTHTSVCTRFPFVHRLALSLLTNSIHCKHSFPKGIRTNFFFLFFESHHPWQEHHSKEQNPLMIIIIIIIPSKTPTRGEWIRTTTRRKTKGTCHLCCTLLWPLVRERTRTWWHNTLETQPSPCTMLPHSESLCSVATSLLRCPLHLVWTNSSWSILHCLFPRFDSPERETDNKHSIYQGSEARGNLKEGWRFTLVEISTTTRPITTHISHPPR